MHHTDLLPARRRTRHGQRAGDPSRPRSRAALVAVPILATALTVAAPPASRADAGARASVSEGAVVAHRVGAEATRGERRSEDADDGARARLVLEDGDGASLEALALDAYAELAVDGLLAELRLEQRFRNASGRWLDGRYLFPLPADAALRALAIEVGERRIEGRVLPRATAAARFEAARESGQVASVVERERPNLFTTRVANIAPGAQIVVRLELVLPVEVGEETLGLVLPTTLTPRYANAASRDPAALATPILPRGAVRGPRLTLTARIASLAASATASAPTPAAESRSSASDPSASIGPGRVTSPTHPLDADGERLVLEDLAMDRDLVLEWPLPGGRAPRALAFLAAHGGERYAQILLAPPARDADPARDRARELVLVVDTSGSMAGESIRAARAAARFALEALDADDRVNLIAFDDSTVALFDAPRPATPATLAAARAFVATLEAEGGTEMAPALALALAARAAPRRTGSADGTPLRQIVFLTDGSVADEDALLAQIRRDIGDARLYAVAIGSAPNRWFIDKAAEIGRGAALGLRDASEVLEAVTALLERIAEPVLTDIALAFDGGAAEHYPERVPDLHAGEPLMILARLDPGVDRVVVAGRHGDAPFRREIALPALPRPDATSAITTPVSTHPEPRSGASTATGAGDGGRERSREPSPRPAPALAMRWARAKVEALEDAERVAADPAPYRAAITALALEVGLVTRYTSLVAVETTPSRPEAAARAQADVASLLPAGNAMLAVTLPAGALGIDTRALAALIAVAAALALLAWAREDRARRRPVPARAVAGQAKSAKDRKGATRATAPRVLA